MDILFLFTNYGSRSMASGDNRVSHVLLFVPLECRKKNFKLMFWMGAQSQHTISNWSFSLGRERREYSIPLLVERHPPGATHCSMLYYYFSSVLPCYDENELIASIQSVNCSFPEEHGPEAKYFKHIFRHDRSIIIALRYRHRCTHS